MGLIARKHHLVRVRLRKDRRMIKALRLRGARRKIRLLQNEAGGKKESRRNG